MDELYKFYNSIKTYYTKNGEKLTFDKIGEYWDLASCDVNMVYEEIFSNKIYYVLNHFEVKVIYQRSYNHDQVNLFLLFDIEKQRTLIVQKSSTTYNSFRCL